MSEEPNLYEIRADLRHLVDRVGDLSAHMDEKDKDDKTYREKQIEILAKLSSSVAELTELKLSVKRLYIFCAVIAGGVSGGAEALKHFF